MFSLMPKDQPEEEYNPTPTVLATTLSYLPCSELVAHCSSSGKKWPDEQYGQADTDVGMGTVGYGPLT